MNILKKIGAPLVAVALVAAMGVSLIATPRTAEAAITATTFTQKVWTGNNIASATVSTAQTLNNIVLTGAIGDFNNTGTVVLALPTGWVWGTTAANGTTPSGTCTPAATGTTACVGTVVAGGAGNSYSGSNLLTLTITGTNTAAGTLTLSGATVRPLAGTSASGNITVDATSTATGAVAATVVATLTRSPFMIAWSPSTTCAGAPNVLTSNTATAVADNLGAGGALCAYVADATTGNVVAGLGVTFTVSLGVVSTGTSKTALAVSNTSGAASTNYRGGGGIAATDTAIASNSLNNIVDTLAITLTSPTGNTASKMIIQQPTVLAVSPTLNNVSPGYISPTTQTNFAVQVQDSAGLGVGGQVVLISVDKGALVAGFAGACGTTKAVTATSALSSAPLALTAGSTDLKAGVIQMTYCGNQNDAPGQATITVSNVSTSMANVTATISTAGRPAKVEATYAGGTISAMVKDAAGNNVADGTVVQFTISSNAGAVSNACTTTTSGKATSAVSLNGTSGSVIVTASYNETGAAAACAAGGGTTGVQTVSTVVNIGGASTPAGSGSTGGSGAFASAPVFSASKQALAVFGGGTVDALDKAVAGANGSGVWAQDAKGGFVLYIIGGGFVNDQFKAAFPNGLAANSAVTVIGK